MGCDSDMQQGALLPSGPAAAVMAEKSLTWASPEMLESVSVKRIRASIGIMLQCCMHAAAGGQ